MGSIFEAIVNKLKRALKKRAGGQTFIDRGENWESVYEAYTRCEVHLTSETPQTDPSFKRVKERRHVLHRVCEG